MPSITGMEFEPRATCCTNLPRARRAFRMWVLTWSRAADSQFDAIVASSELPPYFNIFRRMQEVRIQSTDQESK